MGRCGLDWCGLGMEQAACFYVPRSETTVNFLFGRGTLAAQYGLYSTESIN